MLTTGPEWPWSVPIRRGPPKKKLLKTSESIEQSRFLSHSARLDPILYLLSFVPFFGTGRHHLVLRRHAELPILL